MPAPAPSLADIQPSPRGEGRWLCRPLPFPGMVFELQDEAAKARYLGSQRWAVIAIMPIALASMGVASILSNTSPWLQVAAALALPALGWLGMRSLTSFAPRVPDHLWQIVPLEIPLGTGRKTALTIGAWLFLMPGAAISGFRRGGPTSHAGWVLTFLLVFTIAIILGLWRDNRAARRRGWPRPPRFVAPAAPIPGGGHHHDTK